MNESQWKVLSKPPTFVPWTARTTASTNIEATKKVLGHYDNKTELFRSQTFILLAMYVWDVYCWQCMCEMCTVGSACVRGTFPNVLCLLNLAYFWSRSYLCSLFVVIFFFWNSIYSSFICLWLYRLRAKVFRLVWCILSFSSQTDGKLIFFHISLY